MKLLCFALLGLICVSVGVHSHLVGARECTWGPSYWCTNITNAKTCGAVTHCIQTVWTHQKVKEDNDSVCDICLEMVKEARDTLNSNETQEELKEVFEGSCKLIPVSLISKECIKLADEFIPELVETLSSQMNPMVVCTVAGLCNSAWVDKQLEEYNKAKPDVISAVPLEESLEVGMDDCQQCGVVVDALENRLHTTSRDEILSNMLQACGRLGSLSDSCSAIIITYFSQIHDFLEANLKSADVCHIAGVCSGKFHSHRPQPKKIEVVHESNVGVVKPKDDLPCEFCEQLVIHLRDMLVANTTEEEFEQVLKGLCKQTHSFKDECLSLVDEYYAVIYNFLVNNLQGPEICKLAGLCGHATSGKGPIWPLLPAQTVETLKESGLDIADSLSKFKSIPLVPSNSVGRVQSIPTVPAESVDTIDAILLVPAESTGKMKAIPTVPADDGMGRAEDMLLLSAVVVVSADAKGKIPAYAKEQVELVHFVPVDTKEKMNAISLIPVDTKGRLAALPFPPAYIKEKLAAMPLAPADTEGRLDALSFLPAYVKEKLAAMPLVPADTEGKLDALSFLPAYVKEKLAAMPLVPADTEGRLDALSFLLADVKEKLAAMPLVPADTEGRLDALPFLPADVREKLAAMPLVPADTEGRLDALSFLPADVKEKLAAMPLVPADTEGRLDALPFLPADVKEKLVAMPLVPADIEGRLDALPFLPADVKGKLAAMPLVPADTEGRLDALSFLPAYVKEKLAAMPLVPADTEGRLDALSFLPAYVKEKLVAMPLVPADTEGRLDALSFLLADAKGKLAAMPLVPADTEGRLDALPFLPADVKEKLAAMPLVPADIEGRLDALPFLPADVKGKLAAMPLVPADTEGRLDALPFLPADVKEKLAAMPLVPADTEGRLDALSFLPVYVKEKLAAMPLVPADTEGRLDALPFLPADVKGKLAAMPLVPADIEGRLDALPFLPADVKGKLAAMPLVPADTEGRLDALPFLPADVKEKLAAMPLVPADTEGRLDALSFLPVYVKEKLAAMPLVPADTEGRLDALPFLPADVKGKLAAMPLVPADIEGRLDALPFLPADVKGKLAAMPLVPADTEGRLDALPFLPADVKEKLAAMPLVPADTEGGLDALSFLLADVREKLAAMPLVPADIEGRLDALSFLPADVKEKLAAMPLVPADTEGRLDALPFLLADVREKLAAIPLVPADTEGRLDALPFLPADVREKLTAMPLVPADTDGRLGPIPLVPAKTKGRVVPFVTAQSVGIQKLFHWVSVGDGDKAVEVNKPENVQLPVDRMLPQTIVYVNNKEVCEFCQLFLHYVQQAITSPETETKIETVVKEACDHLPDSVQGQCREFVETYGNAFIALLAQEIDPSQVCPKLGLCPGENKGVLLDMEHTVNDKPTCPFCLLALTSLINKLKDKKTEEEIKNELEHLCTDLPKSLADECNQFVSQYADEVIDMIIADFTPQEICTYLKLCDPTKKKIETTPLPDILSNEIPDYPKRKTMKPLAQKKGKKPASDGTYCIICEFVMSKIDEELQNSTTEKEVEELVKDVCRHLPKTVEDTCDKFVDEYADLVIALLTQSFTPDEVCKAMKLCKSATFKHAVLVDSIKKSVKECAVCEASMGALDELMSDPNLQPGVDKLLQKICPLLPAQDRAECRQIIDIYGPSILNLISTVADPRLVCMEIGLCNFERQTVHLLGGKKCNWGPGYWCQSVAHAKGCDTLEYCQEKIWKAKKPANN